MSDPEPTSSDQPSSQPQPAAAAPTQATTPEADFLAPRMMAIAGILQALGPIAEKLIETHRLGLEKRADAESRRADIDAEKTVHASKQHRNSMFVGAAIIVSLMGGILLIAWSAAQKEHWEVAEKLALPVIAFLSGLALGKSNN